MTKLEKLQQWLLYTPFGQYVLMNEQIFFRHNVSNIFGYYSIQLGLPRINFSEGNKISNHYVINHDIKCDFSLLPFANSSIDLIICPHVLELSSNYKFLLQECYRVLVPRGKLIITGFNQHSLFTLFGHKQEILPEIKLIPLNELKQHICSLKFSILGGKFFCYCPPINNHQIIAKLSWLEKIGNRWFPTLANNYALLVSKEVITPTRIIPATAQYDKKPEVAFGTAKVCNTN